jgi:hypothetical protein
MDLQMKVFVVPMGGKLRGMQEHGSQVDAHPITGGGPDGYLPRFPNLLLSIGRQLANSRHGTDVWILAFVTFRTGHTRLAVP